MVQSVSQSDVSSLLQQNSKGQLCTTVFIETEVGDVGE